MAEGSNYDYLFKVGVLRRPAASPMLFCAGARICTRRGATSGRRCRS